MIYNIEQISNIIKGNPNKHLIDAGKAMANKLMMHIYGYNLDGSINQQNYFENDDIFKVRKSGTISNKDLFARLLQREEMVFTAQGGASFFSPIKGDKLNKLTATLDTIRYGMTLRKWIKSFALQAYRSDPMSVIFMEVDGTQCYPTYKCIASIFDYLPNGRSLEHICFRLKVSEAISFGINDVAFKDMKPGDETNYYRFVDDAYDYLLKYEGESEGKAVTVLTEPKPIKNVWGKTPAFIVSDIMAFDNAKKFLSPLHETIELADCFLNDRSVRDLQKKYHGFLKAIEPLLKCGVCEGTGYLSGSSCPECTPMGSDRGTGYKLRTKVADVARFPLNVLESGSFDFKKIFGYVGPDITVWDKQDASLTDIENHIRDVYWGTDNRQSTTSGPSVGQTQIEETATKTLANLQPIYARLNMTADWAERTENMISDFIGKFMFADFKKASITYGRYYILETPAELYAEYQAMRSKGSSQFVMTDGLRRYYHSYYQTNPIQLAIKLKLINVEPFIHFDVTEVKAMNSAQIDYFCKMYFSEWLSTLQDEYLLATSEENLRIALQEYATAKIALNPIEPVDPGVTVTQTLRKAS